ncbi:response regulator [Candidatus Desulforudis audaxviator]|nr:response regulator [Candidatus Desulforudis audaxviator]
MGTIMSTNGKILLVDDSPLFRAYLKNFINSKYSLEIEEITSTRELSRYLSTFGVDNLLLIIIDLYLPDGNGLEVLHQYREVSGGKEIPFLLVSARIDSSSAALALKTGAKGIIAKPVNLEKLREKVDAILLSEYRLKERASVIEYYDQVKVEVKRAQRAKYPLSLLLAGIFTTETFHALYKESSYHRIIDLKSKYPEKLRGIMRETDSIINLSPSEYFLILPFTDSEGILAVKKKLEKIYCELIPEEERNTLIMVIGTATFPKDSEKPDELISKLEIDFKEQFSAAKRNIVNTQ